MKFLALVCLAVTVLEVSPIPCGGQMMRPTGRGTGPQAGASAASSSNLAVGGAMPATPTNPIAQARRKRNVDLSPSNVVLSIPPAVSHGAVHHTASHVDAGQGLSGGQHKAAAATLLRLAGPGHQIVPQGGASHLRLLTGHHGLLKGASQGHANHLQGSNHQEMSGSMHASHENSLKSHTNTRLEKQEKSESNSKSSHDSKMQFQRKANAEASGHHFNGMHALANQGAGKAKGEAQSAGKFAMAHHADTAHTSSLSVDKVATKNKNTAQSESHAITKQSHSSGQLAKKETLEHGLNNHGHAGHSALAVASSSDSHASHAVEQAGKVALHGADMASKSGNGAFAAASHNMNVGLKTGQLPVPHVENPVKAVLDDVAHRVAAAGKTGVSVKKD